MAVFVSSMKMAMFPNIPPLPPTKEQLVLHLNVVYLESMRKWSNRAYSAEALMTVTTQLSKLYSKGKKLAEQDAPLAELTAVLGEFEHYKVPDELKAMFSEPIILPFPEKKSRKK